MPMIWGYSYAADDYIEMEWVEDADWDQADWDEWDRKEMLHDAEMRRRMTLTPPINDYSEWRNMVEGGPATRVITL